MTELLAALKSLWDQLLAALSSGAPPASRSQRAYAAIENEIVQPLGLSPNATKILLAQSSLETAGWTSHVFAATNSLFNRHKGAGHLGTPNSDGFWTGHIYFASNDDPDLRIYSNIEQSAQDMAELLQDPLYAAALAALEQGDAAAYFDAVAAAGFSASPLYAAALGQVYDEVA